MHVTQCEVCGKRVARYVCQECGRQVCERCLEPHMWICSECYKRLRPEAPMIKSFSWSMPLRLLFLGFLLMSVGIVLVMIAGFLSDGSAGFVWVLPFPPIVVGDGWSYPLWAVIFAVAVTVLGLILFVLFRKQAQRV